MLALAVFVTSAIPTAFAAPSATPPAAPAAPAPSITTEPALRISLVTAPATGRDFSFTGCQVGGGCSTFALDDDHDPTLPSSITADTLPAGTYTVTQAEVPGWTLTDLACSDGATVDLDQRRATITLADGATADCEFTNTSPSITIETTTDPGSAPAFDFTGCQGSGCAGFTLDGQTRDPTHPSSITAAVAPGTYTVTQAAVPHWYLHRISCSTEEVDLTERRVTIVVEPGEQVRCRFENVGRRITIEQMTEYDHPQDFVFSICHDVEGCREVTLDDDDDPTLPSTSVETDLPDGRFVITQGPVTGWGNPQVTCTSGATVGTNPPSVTIDIPPDRGLLVECRFVNSSRSISVVQNSRPASPQDFTYTGCLGSGCASFALDHDNDPTLPRMATAAGLAAGTYTITQDAVPGWPLRSINCTNSHVVDLAQRRVTITLSSNPALQRNRCIFTNGAPAIVLEQDTVPDGPADFAFDTCHIGTGCGVVHLDDDDDDPTLPRTSTSTSHSPGTYWIRQHRTPGYSFPEAECGGDIGFDGSGAFADGFSFRYHATDVVTCRFQNIPAGPPMADVRDVSAASLDACAVTETGGVRCWGNRNPHSASATLADPAASSLAAGIVDGSGQPLSGIVQVGAGSGFRCVLGADGRVRCWGGNSDGRLGDGSLDRRDHPASLSDPRGVAVSGATQLAVGGGHACALLRNRQVRCWGRNSEGQVGDGTTAITPSPVSVVLPDGSGPLTGVVQIAAGARHTCALLDSGQVRCWGQGALGNGSTPITARSLRPVVVSDTDGSGPLTGVVGLGRGGRQDASCAVLASTEVRCWGRNTEGQLGDGTTVDRARPVAVVGTDGTGALSGVAGVAVGSYHSCAHLLDGEARCWGTSSSGELGDNTASRTPTLRPVPVTGPGGTGVLDEVRSMSAGGEYTCAALRNGPLRCWGQNRYWTLATGSTHRWSTPVEVLTTP